MRRLAATLLAATLLGGCTLAGHLYPVQGPLAARTPAPIYPLTLHGPVLTASRDISSGSLSATLKDGEVCTGTWAGVAQDDSSASQMAAEWDSVYGPGFFVANILGTKGFGRSALSCDKGTTLNLEFHVPQSGDVNAIRGVAKDNRGDIFKVTLGVPGPESGGAAPNIPTKQRRTQEITS